jgi:hypothetical protein
LERKKEDQIARHFVKVESEADLDKVLPSNRYNGVLQKGNILYEILEIIITEKSS